MKIAILADNYPPYMGGGITTLSYELSKGLARIGHDVVVVTKGLKQQKVNLGMYRVCYLASPQMPPKDVWYCMLRMKSVKRILVNESPDIIHDLGSVSAFQPWVTEIAPTVISVQGSPQLGAIRRMLSFEDNLRNILFDITHNFQPTIMALFKKPNIKLQVYVSVFVMLDSLMGVRDDKVREELASKSMVVYNGVDVHALRRIRDEVSKNEGIDDYSIVFIGRLMEYKGVRFLVKAFRHVVNDIHEASLHVVGDGPVLNDVRELVRRLGIERNVFMYGSLARGDAMRILARSALLSHPSLYESFGMVIAEAYAMGKPVVTHKAGYAKELVEKPGTGLTVNVVDEREYADALMSLLTDKKTYSKLSQKAYAFAEEELSIEAMIKGYISAYRRALDDPSV